MKQFMLVLLCLALLLGAMTGCNKDNEADKIADPSSGSDLGEKIEDYTVDWDKVVLKQFIAPKDGDDIAILHTNMGDITLRFFPEEAPLAVENFLSHARNGYYDGVLFHHVMYEYILQTGDPYTADPDVKESLYGSGGDSIWGGGFEDEFSPNLYNFRGALTMANANAANTNASQFFIVQCTAVESDIVDDMLDERVWWYNDTIIQKYIDEGGVPWLDRHYTVFGHVIEGMDVVDKIAAVPVVDADNPDAEKRNYLPIDPVVVEWVEVTTYAG